ncbi:glycosyltransferase [Pseudomaricurvus alcaniphilus]|uniref:glycosyltransferase n=1 Tax=Pseudomaricurvus alcaniphilus TaxID=1166482 RepID=UPI001408BEAE|nr:glycosyltransferase [Pseudomaricurvus alcaniphilus]NHN38097.1 glycosyltransferase [Pseudomaricurvus alcaniphilus]
MSNQPLVSIYIPTRNRKDLLDQALASCVAQTYHNIEIIIVDDGSTDDTEILCRHYQSKHSNIVYLKNETPLGAPASRNRAIIESRGEFITGLDDDDTMLPFRIQSFINNHDKRYSFLCSTVIEKNIYGMFHSQEKSKEVALGDVKSKNRIGNQIFISRQRLINSGMFDTKLTAWQDYDLWIRLIHQYGPAIKIGNNSMIVNKAHSAERITTYDTEGSGCKKFLEKHKNLLSETDCRKLIVRDLCNRNVKISVKKIFEYGKNTGLYKNLTILYLRKNYPAIERLAFKLRKQFQDT